jgi:hypothetical protein
VSGETRWLGPQQRRRRGLDVEFRQELLEPLGSLLVDTLIWGAVWMRHTGGLVREMLQGKAGTRIICGDGVQWCGELDAYVR